MKRSAIKRIDFGESRPKIVYFLPTGARDKAGIRCEWLRAKSAHSELEKRIGKSQLWVPAILPQDDLEIVKVIVNREAARSSSRITYTEVERLLRKYGTQELAMGLSKYGVQVLAKGLPNDGTFRLIRDSGVAYRGGYVEKFEGRESKVKEFSPRDWFAVFISRKAPPEMKLPEGKKKRTREHGATLADRRLIFRNRDIRIYEEMNMEASSQQSEMKARRARTDDWDMPVGGDSESYDNW